MSVAGALSMITKNALAIGGGFESVMTSVKVVSGATEKELDKLIKKAREMGATLPISAKDSATAMLLLAQRGMQAEDILAVVSEVANLAISQSTDMATATDLLGSIMTNFNMKVEEAAKIIDMLNNASNQSPLTMQKMTEAFKYVGPAAGAMGMQLSEALAMMEAAIRAVGSGEMAGTGIAMTLTKLASESHILGVRTKELNGQFRPMAAIFSELKEKGLGLAEANKIFGSRAGKTALALINLSDNLKEWETNLKKTDSTQAAVDAKAKTFTNTMAALRSAVEELHIEIFDQIKKQSKEAVGGITELTRAFSKWVGETQIAGKSLNAFLDGLGFKIPSGSDFQKLLQQFDVQAFVNRIKELGSTLKSIGESIASAFSTIKTPLLWLIEHLDTFVQISFWGWILGKGLQIPAAIMGIATSFTALYNSVKLLLGLNWANLLPLLSNPITAAVAVAGVGAYIGASTANKVNEAREELHKARNEEKRYLSEQAKADFTLPVDIELNFKTGFEKLPESWTKASDKVREEANAFIKELQENFRVKVAAALDYVARKFPELADAIKDMGTVSNSTLRQITAALQGDEKAFEALPEHLKKVTEHINAVDAGLVRYGVDFYGVTQKYREFRKEVEKPAQKDESTVFLEEMSASIKSIMADLPAEIERANKFLGGANGQLAVNVSLSQAQSKLDNFVKTASEKYALPKEIVGNALFQQLEKLAQAGNNTAQALINGWKGAGDSLDTFLADAKDAITYLEASPDKFLPSLRSLMNNIQKIDPITGKVTEGFKKAHAALVQWSKTTFDGLMNRISKLSKAAERGFISKRAVEKELVRVAPEIKLQVVKDLYADRDKYGSEANFLAVVANEFSSKIEEIAGKTGNKFLAEEYAGMSGVAIGRSIIRDVEKQLGVGQQVTIDGIKQPIQNLETALNNLSQNISNATNTTQQGNQQRNGNITQPEVTNYSASIEQALQGINNISSGVQEVTTAVNNGVNSLISTVVGVSSPTNTETANFQGVIDALTDNTSALGRASEAVLSLVNFSGNTSQGALYNPDDDYHMLVTDIQNAFAPVSQNIQNLSGNIDALRISTEDNIDALSQFQSALSSETAIPDSQNLSSAFAPLTEAVQSLSTAISTLQAAQQANSSAIGEVISAVRSVENAIKSMNAGNNYDIDINQQGFVIEKKSDADMLARSTLSALRSGIGNGGV
ncbi:MAG: phage tail tape measure protein [Synergistaceae bacterium]|nr:phage tail tape measure protein [Synergistaceae bacterium]